MDGNRNGAIYEIKPSDPMFPHINEDSVIDFVTDVLAGPNRGKQVIYNSSDKERIGKIVDAPNGRKP